MTSCLPSANVSETIAGATQDRPTAYLFVGRLIARKRPLAAIEAFLSVRHVLPGATLTIVGDGPLRGAVIEAAQRGSGRIDVLPRLEGKRLSRVYSASDVLIVPSRAEGWGLVVNEALAHGLYVVATDEVASALDLLDLDCGEIVAARDQRALMDAILRAGTVVRHSPSARRARARRVEHCTAARVAADIERAVTWAVSGDPSPDEWPRRRTRSS